MGDNPWDHIRSWQPPRPPSSPPSSPPPLDQLAQPQVDQVHEYYRSTYYVPPAYNPWAHIALGQPWQPPPSTWYTAAYSNSQHERAPSPEPRSRSPEAQYEVYPGIEGWREGYPPPGWSEEVHGQWYDRGNDDEQEDDGQEDDGQEDDGQEDDDDDDEYRDAEYEEDYIGWENGHYEYDLYEDGDLYWVWDIVA